MGGLGCVCTLVCFWLTQMRQVGCKSKVSISIFLPSKSQGGKKCDNNSATSSITTNLSLISASSIFPPLYDCKTVWLLTSTFIHKTTSQSDSNLQSCQIHPPARVRFEGELLIQWHTVPPHCKHGIIQLKKFYTGDMKQYICFNLTLRFKRAITEKQPEIMHSAKSIG